MRLLPLQHRAPYSKNISSGTITSRLTAKRLSLPGKCALQQHLQLLICRTCCSEGVVAPSSLNIAYVDNSAAIEAICGKARCCIGHFAASAASAVAACRCAPPILSCSIFSILDDECNVPKGSDDNIAPAVAQLVLRLSSGALWNKDKPVLSVAKIGHEKFSVAHYAGDVRGLGRVGGGSVCDACDSGAVHDEPLAGQESRRFEH